MKMDRKTIKDAKTEPLLLSVDSRFAYTCGGIVSDDERCGSRGVRAVVRRWCNQEPQKVKRRLTSRLALSHRTAAIRAESRSVQTLHPEGSSHAFILFCDRHGRCWCAVHRFFSQYSTIDTCALLLSIGFFKGTSADQDRRFSDKEVKLLKSLKFPAEFDKKVRTSLLPIPAAHKPSHLEGGYAQGRTQGHPAMGGEKDCGAGRLRGRSRCRVCHGSSRRRITTRTRYTTLAFTYSFMTMHTDARPEENAD